MKYIEIEARANGAHRNQETDAVLRPEGWAVIPSEMEIPASFPFVDITAADGIVTSITEREIPEPDPEPEPEPEGDIWDELAEAIREGVNSIE